jgi:hypothetical protein
MDRKGKRIMTIHVLKTWSPWFEATRDGKKFWELRRDDRGYRVGDFLVLRQFTPDSGDMSQGAAHPGGLWGPEYVVMRVVFVAAGPFVPPGSVILSLGELSDYDFLQVMYEVKIRNEGGIWSGIGDPAVGR